MVRVKTTIEIPDSLFRKAKSRAAERGQSLKQLVTEALQDKLASRSGTGSAAEPGWMEGFGKLRRLRKETGRVRARIDEAFEILEPEERPIPANDAWISALARQHRLPVLSRDQHFDAVPGVERKGW
jgi:hypothetical protein